MSIAIARERLNPVEMGTLVVGFLLVGIAIAVTTVSYALNMTFQYQWLVWVITAAFGAVALITLAWPVAWDWETGWRCFRKRVAMKGCRFHRSI